MLGIFIHLLSKRVSHPLENLIFLQTFWSLISLCVHAGVWKKTLDMQIFHEGEQTDRIQRECTYTAERVQD